MEKENVEISLPDLLPYEREDARRSKRWTAQLCAITARRHRPGPQSLKIHAEQYHRWKEVDRREEIDRTVFDTLATLSMGRFVVWYKLRDLPSILSGQGF